MTTSNSDRIDLICKLAAQLHQELRALVIEERTHLELLPASVHKTEHFQREKRDCVWLEQTARDMSRVCSRIEYIWEASA